MPFQKGQSGNPKGAPRKRDTLRTWLQRVGRLKNEQGVTRDQEVIHALYAKALGGDIGAIRLILEYRLGRPPQMEVSARDAARDAPVKMYMTVSPDDWPAP